MKKIIFLMFLPIFGLAQDDNSQIEHLLKSLQNAPNDTIRMDINRQLGFYYQDSESQIALPYHQAQLQLAKKLDLQLYEADAYQQIGYCYLSKGNLSEAYKNYLRALKVAENPSSAKNGWGYSNFSYSKSPEEARLSIVGMTNYELSDLYSNTGSSKKVRSYQLKALKIGEKLHNQKILCLTTRNIGNDYFFNKNTDSAFYYYKKALRHYKNSPYQKHLGTLFQRFGDYYIQKKEYDSAKIYYQKAINRNDAATTQGALVEAYLNYGSLFIKTKKLDSALVYTLKGQKIAYSIKHNFGVAQGYLQLATIYKLKNNTELAYENLTKGKQLSDSLNYSYTGKLLQFKNVDFEQKIRLQELEKETDRIKSRNRMFALATWLGIFLLIALFLYRNNRQKQKANKTLEKTLIDLKSTQSQLIQSEKMASLGELTAGIAHEIQNPLNFVNNFSEVSAELLDEMNEELKKGDIEEAKAIANDVKQNLEKINHHGKRADAIVKGMLQHSRSSSGIKEPTDINKLADEYLRLAYHGLRAKDKSFNATMKTNFDETIGDINIIPQDIGRVILNLITNAFYAVKEKKTQLSSELSEAKSGIPDYEPTVTVSTKKTENNIEISVQDNGNGIPQKVLDKIFQPFFTTKPTGQGTGLGLSLSYDIVKAHGGELKVEMTDVEETKFIITLPI